MEISQLQALVTIAQEGSISKAAEVLHITQPALSRRLANLETELDVALFDRQSSGLRLTEEGDLFLPFAMKALATVNDGMEALANRLANQKTRLRIAMVGTLASTELTQRLAILKKADRNLQISLRTALSKEVSSLVQSGTVHFGLRYFAAEQKDLESIKIAEESMVIVASAENRRFTEGDGQDIDLNDANWFVFPRPKHLCGSSFYELTQQHLEELQITDYELFEADSLTAQKRLIEADFGIGLLPESSVKEELSLGSLILVQEAKYCPRLPIYMVRRKGGFQPPSVDQLIESLKD